MKDSFLEDRRAWDASYKILSIVLLLILDSNFKKGLAILFFTVNGQFPQNEFCLLVAVQGRLSVQPDTGLWP